MKTGGVFFWLALAFLLFTAAESIANVFSVAAAGPGSPVEVRVAGVDPQSVTAAFVGGAPAPILSRGSETVTIQTPAAASTAPVRLQTSQGDKTTPIQLIVLRELPVSMQTGFSNYTLSASLFGESANGKAPVATKRATLLFATTSDIGPLLLAVATDATQSVQFGPRSTAIALLFMSPLAYASAADEAEHRLQVIRQLPELDALANVIAQFASAGIDYEEALEFLETYESALLAYVNSSGLASPLNQPSTKAAYTMADGYPRDLKTAGYEKLDRIEPRWSGGISDGEAVLEIKFEAAPLADNQLGKFLRGNPLEWKANLYALDINDDRLDTRTEVSALKGSFNTVYDRWSDNAVDSVVVPSKPFLGNLDLIGMAESYILGKANGAIGSAVGAETKTKLFAPADEPGLYMIRSFSGARFPLQNNLIEQLPGGRQEDMTMLTLNTVLVVNDVVGIFVNAQSAVSESQWIKLLISLETTIGKSLESAAAEGTLSADFVASVAQGAISVAMKWAWDQMKGTILGSLSLPHATKLGKRFATLFKSVANVSGKVASIGKIVERITALTNLQNLAHQNAWLVQAVEDTLVVVGDPWAPLIHSVEPAREYRGNYVTIYGEGFSTVKAENIVTIGYLGTDIENPPEPVRCEIITARQTSLEIRVPEGAQTGLITVHVTGAGTAISDKPFEVIPEPVLVSVSPETIYPGDSIVVTGQHFPTDSNSPPVFELRGSGSLVYYAAIKALTPTLAVIDSGGNHGEFQMRMIRSGKQSNAIPVVITPFPERPLGGQAYVTTTADNNVRDGELSLREAIMLCEGLLDRSQLTSPPPDRPPGVRYETDWLSGNGFGNAYNNSIISGISSGSVITLTSPLPPIKHGTSIQASQAPFTINGNGLPVGLLFDGTSGSTTNFITLTGFSEAAVRVTGGTRASTLALDVDGGAGHGVELLDSAQSNTLYTRVRNVGGDGIRLSGESVYGNGIWLMKRDEGPYIDKCGGWGISIRDGAKGNVIYTPQPTAFGQDSSAGISRCSMGGILITGLATEGNSIDRPFSNGSGTPIWDNGGPGLRVEAPNTLIRFVWSYGNDGNGIEVIGPATGGVRIIDSVFGFDRATDAGNGNAGHGILISGAKNVRVGSDYNEFWVAPQPVQIGANEGSGIRVENSEHVTLRSLRIGRLEFPTTTPQVYAYHNLPNGVHGIEIINSQDCVIGSNYYDPRVEITNHLNGSGIRIAGQNSTRNRILGCLIGCQAGGLSFSTAVPIQSIDYGNTKSASRAGAEPAQAPARITGSTITAKLA